MDKVAFSKCLIFCSTLVLVLSISTADAGPFRQDDVSWDGVTSKNKQMDSDNEESKAKASPWFRSFQNLLR